MSERQVAERVRHFIVASLEAWCDRLHFVTHHRPWLWLPIRNGHCLLAAWSSKLEDRWHTGVWTTHSDGSESAK